MLGSRLAASLLLLWAVAISSELLASGSTHRSMYVSVLNEAGAPVPGLGPSDFIIREDDVAREVLSVAPADDPMQVALLVDDSVAATDLVRDIRTGLEQFVATMTAPSDLGAANQLALIAVADRPTMLADYTSDRGSLLKAVGRIFTQPQSGMYLLDALIDVSRGLIKRDARRPVIISITTEGAEFSNRQHDQVLGPLLESGARYEVLLFGMAAVSEAHERAIVFDDGTRLTGGRQQILPSSTAVIGALRRLAAELQHQYLVTYAHPESLIPPERVKVTAKRPGLTVRGVLVKEPGEQGRP